LVGRAELLAALQEIGAKMFALGRGFLERARFLDPIGMEATRAQVRAWGEMMAVCAEELAEEAAGSSAPSPA